MNTLIDESYSQRLWRQFRRDSLAMIGLWMVVLAFVVAALAPFLANNHAIVRVTDGRVSFPIFRSLGAIEWRFLIYVPLSGIIFLVRRPLFRVPWRGWVMLALLLAMCEFGIIPKHPYNDTGNDRTQPETFKLMPLIPYSPIESSPDQLVPPSREHWCGTDSTGRDVAARMIYGAQVSLSVGVRLARHRPGLRGRWWGRWRATIGAGSTSSCAGSSRCWSVFRRCC